MSFKIKSLLLFVVLFLATSGFAQFSLVQRGPISGACAGNPKLAIDLAIAPTFPEFLGSTSTILIILFQKSKRIS